MCEIRCFIQMCKVGLSFLLDENSHFQSHIEEHNLGIAIASNIALGELEFVDKPLHVNFVDKRRKASAELFFLARQVVELWVVYVVDKVFANHSARIGEKTA